MDHFWNIVNVVVDHMGIIRYIAISKHSKISKLVQLPYNRKFQTYLKIEGKNNPGYAKINKNVKKKQGKSYRPNENLNVTITLTKNVANKLTIIKNTSLAFTG